MVLRPAASGLFKVIGPCYVHGFWDGEAVLGPLPPSWNLKYYRDEEGIDIPSFFNRETGQTKSEDLRLGPLRHGWKRLSRERPIDDPLTVTWFQNELNGEVMNSDPRVLPEVLKEHGVKVRTFHLL